MLKTLLALGLIFCVASAHAGRADQSGVLLRPYLNGGGTLLTPSSEELEYRGVTDNMFKMRRFGVGGGAQLLFVRGEAQGADNSLRWGVDIGFRRLFRAKVYGDLTQGVTWLNVNRETEYDLSLLALVERTRRGKVIYLQAGIGLHVIFWDWTRDYAGLEGHDVADESSCAVNPGLMAAGGFNLVVSRNVVIPVMVRANLIFRHGLMLPVYVTLGWDFPL
ncbi:MAG: hypothetical protein KAU35_00225 [candidate division Zixibacteria bacterium]|nr:hypothetical protein [candidate division Zixibacteria bacterium]